MIVALFLLFNMSLRKREKKINTQKNIFYLKDLIILGSLGFLLLYGGSAFSQALGRDPFGRVLIPAIINLKNGDSISDEVFDKYDSRSIGESIVYRISKTRKKSRYIGTPFNAFQDAEIHYYFSFQELTPNQIFTDGILNIFQVNTPDTMGLRWFRSMEHEAIANRLAGLQIGSENEHLGSKINFVRPKYTGLAIKLGKELNYKTDGLDYFGEITAVMKPAVLLRATYTPYDSGSTNLLARAQQEVRPLTEPYLYAPKGGYSQYFEAQVWGALDLRDIKEFLVPSTIDFKTLGELKKGGIPIYQYEETREHERYRRLKDRLLYAGNPRKQEQLNESLLQSRQPFVKNSDISKLTLGSMRDCKKIFESF
jgi:hypothetical protein